MTDIEQTPPPQVKWAQSRSQIFLTFCLEDVQEPNVKIESDCVHFSAIGGTEKKLHRVTIEFFGKVDVNKVKENVTGRLVELVLLKDEEAGPYWPQLTKEKKKYGYLSVDFTKWVDEDDSEAEDHGGAPHSMENMMNLMGGLDSGNYDYSKLQDDDGAGDSSDDGEGDMPDLEEVTKDDSDAEKK